MNQNSLNQKVELYDPHPGFGGAVVPLPKIMKDLADGLNGKVMSLETVLDEISLTAKKSGGYTRLVEEHEFIAFGYKEQSGREHFFRLIRYKKQN